MTEELKRELSFWLENRPLKNKPHVFMCLEKRAFHFEHYGEPFKFRAKFMKTLCLKAGVKPFGFHAIRHLTASQLYSMGYSVATIQALLRHKSPGRRNGISGLSGWSTSGTQWKVCRPWEKLMWQLPKVKEPIRSVVIRF
jgi:integrase